MAPIVLQATPDRALSFLTRSAVNRMVARLNPARGARPCQLRFLGIILLPQVEGAGPSRVLRAMAATFGIPGQALQRPNRSSSFFARCRFYSLRRINHEIGAWLRGLLDTKLKCLS